MLLLGTHEYTKVIVLLLGTEKGQQENNTLPRYKCDLTSTMEAIALLLGTNKDLQGTTYRRDTNVISRVP